MGVVPDRLRQRIRRHGPITFAEFMEEALYGAGGYYARERLAIGPQGDYVTGSSLSPLFGRATARVLRRLAEAGAGGDYLEAGYGSGEHLAAVVDALGCRRGRLLGWDRVPRQLPEGVQAVAGLAELEAAPIEGMVFSYELFDALPVHRLVGRAGGGPGELWVDWSERRGFHHHEGELSDPALAGLLGAVELAAGQVADLAAGWAPLYRRLARCLARGLLVTCDYGYERHRLLDLRMRRHGTLACYTRHRVHRDPFRAPGEHDLTAHVDFTALVEAGEDAGLETVALTRQARWLVAAGIFGDLEGAGRSVRGEAMRLLDGAGMGEEIRVLVQAKGVAAERILELEMLG